MSTVPTHCAPPRLAALALPLLLSGCAVQAPACNIQEDRDVAPAAGCFALREGGVLIVEQTDGKFSLPGGKANPGESARCAAQRETWEETGLQLQVGQLLQVFDNGFHLYHCEQPPGTGDPKPPRPMEIERAMYLQAEEFDGLNWRFPEQVDLMRKLIRVNGAD